MSGISAKTTIGGILVGLSMIYYKDELAGKIRWLTEQRRNFLEWKEKQQTSHLESLDVLFEELNTLLQEEERENKEPIAKKTNDKTSNGDLNQIDGDSCHHCGKQIKEGDKFLLALGKKWHPEHFTCCFCHRPIDSKQFLHNCWEQVYCVEHEEEAQRCFSCQRVIPQGSFSEIYADDRRVCEYCSESTVHEMEPVLALWKLLVDDVFKLPSHLKDIRLEFADKFKMQAEHKGEITDNGCQDHLLGLTKTMNVITTYSDSKYQSLVPIIYNASSVIEKVLILQGLPLLLTSVVLAHELGHCLACKEGYKLPRKEEEGLCELFAYIWLSKLSRWNKNKPEIENNEVLYLISNFNMPDIEFHRRRIEENKNDVYGKGFREALGAVEKGWTFRKLMKYVKQNRRYPVSEYGQVTDQMDIREEVSPISSPSSSIEVQEIMHLVSKFQLGIVKWYELGKEVISKVLNPVVGPESSHKRIIVTFGEKKIFIFFDQNTISFNKLQTSIQERLEELKGKELVITHCGVPLRCDEDVEYFKNDDQLVVELGI